MDAPRGCADPSVGREIESYEAGILEDLAEDRFEAHLLNCEACWRELRQLESFRLLSRSEEVRCEVLGTLRAGEVIPLFPHEAKSLDGGEQDSTADPPAVDETRPRLAAETGGGLRFEAIATFSAAGRSEVVRVLRKLPEDRLIAHVGVEPESGPHLVRLIQSGVPDVEEAVDARGRASLPPGTHIDPNTTRVEIVSPSARLELERVPKPNEESPRWVLRGGPGRSVSVELSPEGEHWNVVLSAPERQAEGTLRILIQNDVGDRWLVTATDGRAEIEALEPSARLSAAVFPTNKPPG